MPTEKAPELAPDLVAPELAPERLDLQRYVKEIVGEMVMQIASLRAQNDVLRRKVVELGRQIPPPGDPGEDIDPEGNPN